MRNNGKRPSVALLVPAGANMVCFGLAFYAHEYKLAEEHDHYGAP